MTGAYGIVLNASGQRVASAAVVARRPTEDRLTQTGVDGVFQYENLTPATDWTIYAFTEEFLHTPPPSRHANSRLVPHSGQWGGYFTGTAEPGEPSSSPDLMNRLEQIKTALATNPAGVTAADQHVLTDLAAQVQLDPQQDIQEKALSAFKSAQRSAGR